MGFKAANGFRKFWLLAAARWSQAPERFEFVQKSQRHFFQRVEPAIEAYIVELVRATRVHNGIELGVSPRVVLSRR